MNMGGPRGESTRDAVVGLVAAGDWLVLNGAGSFPFSFGQALAARAHDLRDVVVLHHMWREPKPLDPDYVDRDPSALRHVSEFVFDGAVRGAVDAASETDRRRARRRADPSPCHAAVRSLRDLTAIATLPADSSLAGLGLHSEGPFAPMVELIERGVVDNSAKMLHRGRTVCALTPGGQRVYDARRRHAVDRGRRRVDGSCRDRLNRPDRPSPSRATMWTLSSPSGARRTCADEPRQNARDSSSPSRTRPSERS